MNKKIYLIYKTTVNDLHLQVYCKVFYYKHDEKLKLIQPRWLRTSLVQSMAGVWYVITYNRSNPTLLILFYQIQAQKLLLGIFTALYSVAQLDNVFEVQLEVRKKQKTKKKLRPQ